MYFSPDYFTARTRFRTLLEKAGGKLETLQLGAKGPRAEALGIDIAWFGPEKPERVLLHSSGLHGVEAFAGSAIQLQLLSRLPEIPGNTALIVAHVLNPYGMAWLRRVNESNVDLNRNFLGSGAYAGAPESYAAFDSFLNPQSPPRRDFFLLKAQWLILRHGMPAMKTAVATGQYEFSRGLFFGGNRLEEGAAKYKAFLESSLASAEHVVAIDVHTGLGAYGEDTLLAEPELHAVAYTARGNINGMIARAAPQAQVAAVCQEFGTYGPVTVLQALRQENRWAHFGAGGVEHATKVALRETFCPPDEAWQRSVLIKGEALLRRAFDAIRSR